MKNEKFRLTSFSLQRFNAICLLHRFKHEGHIIKIQAFVRRWFSIKTLQSNQKIHFSLFSFLVLIFTSLPFFSSYFLFYFNFPSPFFHLFSLCWYCPFSFVIFLLIAFFVPFFLPLFSLFLFYFFFFVLLIPFFRIIFSSFVSFFLCYLFYFLCFFLFC